MAQIKPHRTNDDIVASTVRLVGESGKQEGIVSLQEALAMARSTNADLVEIAPSASPPVCKIMDYGRYKYKAAKKANESKVKQKQIQVKEIKFRPNTDEHDYQVKLKRIIDFLTYGDKVKITLRFRGREMMHQDLGLKLLERVCDEVSEISTVENMPTMEGRHMVMILSPDKKKK